MCQAGAGFAAGKGAGVEPLPDGLFADLQLGGDLADAEHVLERAQPEPAVVLGRGQDLERNDRIPSVHHPCTSPES